MLASPGAVLREYRRGRPPMLVPLLQTRERKLRRPGRPDPLNAANRVDAAHRLTSPLQHAALTSKGGGGWAQGIFASDYMPLNTIDGCPTSRLSRPFGGKGELCHSSQAYCGAQTMTYGPA